MIKYNFYKLKFAICSFDYAHSNGNILFTQYPLYTKVQFQLKNLPQGSYGLYVHEFGDESVIYDSLGSQYIDRTLGKITINSDGKYENTINFNKLYLDKIIGRSIIMYDSNNKKITYGIIGYRGK